jgi:UDP-N-acetylmuramoylalanine--D-glutamate ligase
LRVAVLGLGKSGRAAARLARARGAASVYASDVAAGPVLERTRAELEALGIEVELGRHDPARLAAADLAVISPGIPPGSTPLASLPGVRTVGELELASWYLEAAIAAVTGTNGKTTTTALLQAMCERGGVRSVAAGNIGLPLAEVALAERPLDWAVCEVSSFQLAATETFHPHVGVLTNLAPDHLDRYPDLAAYAADKERLARNMTAGDALVLNADDPGSGSFAAGAPAARWYFTAGKPVRAGLGVARGQLLQLGGDGRVRPIAELRDIRLRGPHNLQNALAASLAALLMGVEPPAVARGLREFRGVPHRLEEVARIDGVLFVNDSKATNVDATLWALRSFDGPLHVILGGRHKGSPYAPLLPEMAGKVKQVLALGEARERIVEELGGAVRVQRAASLADAVKAAFRDAVGGDVVLLSPACSSYDMFRDFEDRGESFRQAVQALRRSPAYARGGGVRREDDL